MHLIGGGFGVRAPQVQDGEAPAGGGADDAGCTGEARGAGARVVGEDPEHLSGGAGQVTRGAAWAASSGAGGWGLGRGSDPVHGWVRTGSRVVRAACPVRWFPLCRPPPWTLDPPAPSSGITPGHKRRWRTARVRARSGAGTPVQTEHSRRQRCRRKRHRVGMVGPMTTCRTHDPCVGQTPLAGLLSPERPRCIRVSNAKKDLGPPQGPFPELVRVCRRPGWQVARYWLVPVFTCADGRLARRRSILRTQLSGGGCPAVTSVERTPSDDHLAGRILYYLCESTT